MRSFIMLSTLSFLLKVCVLVEGRYVVEVRLNGYTNPSGKCNSVNCFPDMHRQTCCDSDNTDKCMGWERCDSYFVYCLRPFGTVRLGCFDNKKRAISAPNVDDVSGIDFSQSEVLGLSNPQNFSGLGDAYVGIQIYIEVIDVDLGRHNSNEFVDFLTINYNLPVAESLQHNHTGFYRTVTMDLTITVVCGENFEGSNCIQCSPGLTGPDCNETDYYSGVSCSDNGVCRNVVNSQFQCTCSPGFTSTGMYCETNIDGCVGVDCSGNGNQSGSTDDARGGAQDVGAIAGGVVGALLAVVVLLILVIAVVIILKHYNNRKEVNKGNVNSGPLPVDNPVYEQGNATNELKGDFSLNTRTLVTTLPEVEGTENGAEERNFDNFIYGDDIDDDDDIDDGGHVYTAPFDLIQQDQQSLHDSREFDNPIYGTDTSDS